MTNKVLSITVKGKNKTWGFNFYGDPKYLADWRADGLQVDEVVGSIPVWAVELGLTKLWFRLQDIFNFRNPWRK